MTTVDLRPILDIRVSGTPRPKGSLKPFVTKEGKPRAREQNVHSGDWRSLVVDAAYRAIRCDCDPTCRELKPGYPYLGAAKVIVRLWFVRPKNRPSTVPKGTPPEEWLPATVATGDIEKQARNIHDALQDAGVIRNDAQVTDLVMSARYIVGAAHAEVIVWPAVATEPNSVRTCPEGTPADA